MRIGEKLQNWVVDTWTRQTRKARDAGETQRTFEQEMA